MTLPHSAVLALCLALASPAMAAEPMTARAAAAAKALTGTWALVRYENTAPDGTVTMPFGAHPQGLFHL